MGNDAKEGKRVLLHTCCAPCTTKVSSDLISQGFDVSGFFYNPNIHPYSEFDRRLMTMKLFSIEREFPVEYVGSYDIENFFYVIHKKADMRCLYCYELRLHRTATAAKAGGFDSFSTTLLLSPYQKHDLLREAGEIVGKKIGIPFLYKDFRPLYRASVDEAKAMNLYRQKYCGCLYSEMERFKAKLSRA